MNEAQLRKEMLTSLGHPILCIELKPGMMDQIFRTTYRWFSAKKGLRARDQITLVAGTNSYLLPDNVLDVTEVYPPAPEDVASYFTGDLIGFGGVYIGGFGFGGAGQFGGIGPFGGRFGGRDMLPYSGMAQLVQFNESATNILGADFEWEYFNGSLIINPIPSTGNLLIYDYVKRLTDLTELKEGSKDLDFVIRYVKAEMKEIVGRIRRKFDQLPGAEDAITLDGDRLLDDAATEKEALNEEISESGYPMGFFAA